MINLIPPEGHKIVRREYLLRVFATALFLFGFVCIILTVALLPKYLRIGTMIHAFALETQKVGNKDAAFLEAEKEVLVTRDILLQLKMSKESVTASEAIEEIQKHAPPEVVFKNFSTELLDGVIERVKMQGVAPTREDLLHLKVAIEESEMFETAEVPISDLALDINVPFSITITLTRKK